MNKRSVQNSSPVFGVAIEELETLGIEKIASIIAAGTDVVIVAGKDGTIREASYSKTDLGKHGLKNWKGRNLRDIVTVESVEKIERILDDARKPGFYASYQVNHPAANQNDLPVKYSVIREAQWDHLLLLGEDLRPLMAMQQKLVQTQLDLETEYRNLQQNEVRYRTVFQMLPQPLALIDGQKKTIIDLNISFALAFGTQAGKLIGKPLQGLFKRNFATPLIDAVSEVRHSGATKEMEVDAARSAEKFLLEMTPYRENGASNILLSLRTEAEPARAQTAEGDTASISLNDLPEPVVVIDGKGIVTSVNDRMLDLVKLANKNLIVGRSISNWIGASNVDLQVLLSKLKDDQSIRGFSTTVRDQLGGEKPVQLSASTNHPANEVYIVVSAHHAGDNQVAMRRLGQSEEAGGFSELVGRVPLKELVRESLDVIEKMCIETALDQTRNNRASAAELLGLSRQSLYIKLRKHGLENYTPGSSGQN